MSGFGHYARTADELEREIVKRGIAIGLDFGDAVRLRDRMQGVPNGSRKGFACTTPEAPKPAQTPAPAAPRKPTLKDRRRH